LVHFALLADVEPIKHNEALKNEAWKPAMTKELVAIQRNKSWKLVKLQANKKGIEAKWVQKLKKDMILHQRILRYLKGTVNYGIFFPASSDDNDTVITCYSDSDWCGNKSDRRSTTGYFFKVSSAPISWCSRKQPVVALSSCEAEYIAGSYAACQAIWIESVLSELKIQVRKQIVLQLDNKSAITLAKNPVQHGRSKHIEARFHFLREHVTHGKLEVKHCPSESQLADILTKGLKIDRFLSLRKKLGIILFD